MLVDVNLLLYAAIAEYAQHAVARAWLDDALDRHARVGLPWESLLGFLRIATDSRMLKTPMPVRAGLATMRDWLDHDGVWIPTPGDRHAAILAGLLEAAGRGGKLVPDAHLAALAIEHRLTLCSTDGDFARFPGLRWENPLQRL